MVDGGGKLTADRPFFYFMMVSKIGGENLYGDAINIIVF